MLINDDDGLEREADVMGAKAGVLGEQVEAAVFHARIATASGAGLDYEPFVVAMIPTAQHVASQLEKPRMSISNVPVIQRVANFVAGTVNATTNLAAHLIAGRKDAGFTPPTLNRTQILSAAAQHNEWIRLNNLLHTAGATLSNSAANANCTTSSLDVS